MVTAHWRSPLTKSSVLPAALLPRTRGARGARGRTKETSAGATGDAGARELPAKRPEDGHSSDLSSPRSLTATWVLNRKPNAAKIPVLPAALLPRTRGARGARERMVGSSAGATGDAGAREPPRAAARSPRGTNVDGGSRPLGGHGDCDVGQARSVTRTQVGRPRIAAWRHDAWLRSEHPQKTR